MPGTHPPYPPEFRRRLVELVRSGRSPEELAKEFETSAQTIRNWTKQADLLDEGRREDGLTTEEREELRRLRRAFSFVRQHQARHSVRTACRVLGVSPSGYYAWLRREPCARARRDEELKGRIRAIHGKSRGTYGVPRVHAELVDEGEQVARKRIARLMRELELEGVSRRKKRRTTVRSAAAAAADLVQRNFTASAPDQLWVADITYVPTWAGFL